MANDAYDHETKTAIEGKDYHSGNVNKSGDVEREAEADLILLGCGEINAVKWIFTGRGPSGPLFDLLNKTLDNGKKIEIYVNNEKIN